MISVTWSNAKFAPVWAIILKICAIFVHQTLTEHALYSEKTVSLLADPNCKKVLKSRFL